jgi:hypothetical protein
MESPCPSVNNAMELPCPSVHNAIELPFCKFGIVYLGFNRLSIR